MTTESAAAAVSRPWRSRAQEGAASRPLVATVTAVTAGWIVAVVLNMPDGRWLDPLVKIVPVLLVLPSMTLWSIFYLRRRAVRPGLLVREGTGFYASASWRFGVMVAAQVLMLPLFTAEAISRWRDKREWPAVGPSLDLAGVRVAVDNPARALAVATSVFVLVAAGSWALLVVGMLSRLPRLELTPAAIELHDIFGICVFPWDALRSGLPARVDDRRRLTLVVDRPELVVGIGLVRRRQREGRAIWAGETSHLRRVIQHYADQPEEREAIGTKVEHQRVLSQFWRQ